MTDIERLLVDGGPWVYAALFLYAVVKTGPLPVAAAYASTLGWLDAEVAFVAVAAGAIVGDELRFEIGRRYGAAPLRWFPRWAPRVEAAMAVLVRYHVAVLVLFRFAKGLRTPVSFGLGASSLARARFSLLNVLTALAWSGVLSALGILAGAAFAADSSRLVAVGGLVALIVMTSGLGWAVHRELGRRVLQPVGVPAASASSPRSAKPGAWGSGPLADVE